MPDIVTGDKEHRCANERHYEKKQHLLDKVKVILNISKIQNYKQNIMSLIKCPECGKVFSDRAAHCPQCGLPTSDALKVIVNEEQTHNAQQNQNNVNEPNASQIAQPQPMPEYRPEPPKKQNGPMLYVLIGVVIVLALALIVMVVANKFGSSDMNADDTDTTEIVPELDADTIETPPVPKVEEQPVEEQIPANTETEEIPASNETEETQTATPAPAPASPAEPAQTAPAQQHTQPAQ
mgnify:CR=1 FL=1